MTLHGTLPPGPFACGLTGVAIVLLSSVAYSVQVTLDSTATSHFFAGLFVVLNLIGWALGHRIYSRDSQSAFGISLLLLADVIFPLNLYAPIVLYLLEGEAAVAASGVVVLGIVYHARNYRTLETTRFHPLFFPYFFAGAGAGLITLSRWTLGVPEAGAIWLAVVLSGAYGVLAERSALEPRGHFATAGSLVTFAAVVAAAALLGSGGDPALLLAIFAGAAVTLASSLVPGVPQGLRRVIACVGVLALTGAFTATLYVLGAPLWLYVVATALWVMTLAGIGNHLTAPSLEPVREAGYWASLCIGPGLLVALAPQWLRSLGLGSVAAGGPSLTLAPQWALLVSGSLIGVGGALSWQAVWRLRYPTIAWTVPGFVATQSALRLASYGGTLALLLGVATLPSAVGAAATVLLVTLLLAAGALLLVVPGRVAESFPRGPLDVGAVAALALTLSHSGSPAGMAAQLAGAALLLVRALGTHALWPLGAALALAAWAVVPAAWRASGPGALPLVLAGAACVPLAAWLETRGERPVKATITLTFGLLCAVLALGAALVVGHMPLWVAAGAWLGLWLGLAATRGAPASPAPAGLRVAGYVVATLASAVVVLLALDRFGWGRGYEGPVLAGWAWLHLAGSAASPSLARIERVARGTAVHVLAALSVGFALLTADAGAWALCAISYGALGFELRTAGARTVGYLLVLVGATLATRGGAALAAVGLGAAALVLIWRATRERSFAPHAAGLFLAAGAAAGAVVAGAPPVQLLPFSLLAPSLLVLVELLRTSEGRQAKLDTTTSVAYIAAAAAVALELLLGRPQPLVFVPVWLGFMVVLVARSRVPLPTAGQRLDQRLGYWISHAAGTALVWSLARAYGAGQAAAALAVALWAVAPFTVVVVDRYRRLPQSLSRAARDATLGTCGAAIALAASAWSDGFAATIACGVATALLLVWRRVEPSRALDHLVATTVGTGWIVTGLAHGAPVGDHVVAAVGLYGALVLILGSERQAREASAKPEPRADEAASVLGVLLAVAYPLVALLATRAEIHIYYLGGASVVALFALLVSGQRPSVLYAASAPFPAGAAFLLLAGRNGPAVQGLLVLAGCLLILNLTFARNAHTRRLDAAGGMR